MKTLLDCMPCFVRQALEAARMMSDDPSLQEGIVREVLQWAGSMDLGITPPAMGQRIHRRLREITGVADPYRAAKERLNRMALDLSSGLRAEVDSSPDPLMAAVRLAIAGNVIDMGAHGEVAEPEVRRCLHGALTEPLHGDPEGFRRATAGAKDILYVADNAGEIVFDRLLIERLGPDRVTVAVRGGPVLNDATINDARAVGLDQIVEVIDNGSDAPATILEDCSEGFRRRYEAADLVLAKGQGNYETLNDEPKCIFFLFKAKCPVIAAYVGLPVGSLVLAAPRTCKTHPGGVKP
jgi:uncharacterized protein with ATP-grasp and redox domains